jgi:hypothetical protein
VKADRYIITNMKRAIGVIAVALALPLGAQEKTDKTATAAAGQPPVAGQAAQSAQPDSPLVAAAKRANRLGRKSKSDVITNDSVKSSGGTAHVTTSSAPSAMHAPKPMEPARPTPEMVAAEEAAKLRKKLAEETLQQKAAREEKTRKQERAAAATEQGYDGTEDDASEFAGTQPPPPQL